jgi:hypothetical protein
METPKGKTSILRASLALFVSFIALYKMFRIQYKLSTNLLNSNSNTRIRKPWAEKPNTMDCETAHHNTAKNNPKKKLGNPPLNPRIRIADMVLVLTHQKPTGEGLEGYPPPTQAHRACTLVKLGVKLHAKNIT